MALNALKFDILANDLTGRAFGSVRNNLRSTEGAIASFQTRSRAIGRSLTVAGAAASAAITLPVSAFLKDSLTLFGAQAEAVTAVAAAVKSTGGAAGLTTKELEKMASQLQAVTTFGDEDILQNVTAPLLTFTKVQGEVFAQAQTAVLDMATLLKTDLRSAALQVGKALNDPVKGVTALGRAGVQFSEQQKSLIKSLVETGQVAAAQQIILAELQTQFGGQAAAAAQTPLGPLKQLANAWGDLKEEVGAIVAEILPPVVAVLKSIIAGFQSLSPEVKRFIVVGAGLAAVVGPLVTVLGLFALGISAISAPALAVVGAIAALTAALVAFWPEIQAGYEAVKGALTDLVDFIDQPLEDIVAQSRDFLVDQLGKVWDDVKAALGVVRGVFVAVFGEEIVAQVERSFTGIVTLSAELIAGVSKWLVEGLARIRDRIIGILGGIKDAFLDLWREVVGGSIVPDMVIGVDEWFARMESDMIGRSEAATTAVSDNFKRMGLDIDAVSAAGISASDDLSSSLGGGFRSVAEEITGPFREALRGGELSFGSFVDSLTRASQRLADTLIDDVFARINDAIAGIGSSSSSGAGGGGFFGSLLGGIGSLFGGKSQSIAKATSAANAGGFGLFDSLGNVALPKLAGGADFIVGGQGGVDQNVVAFRASSTERVRVTTPAQERGEGPLVGSMVFHIQAPDERTGRLAAATAARQVSRSIREARRVS